MAIDGQEIYQLVDRFDDAHWIRQHGADPRSARDQLEILTEEDAKGLVREYWALMSRLLQPGNKNNKGGCA